jgi:hypothetical protein
MTMPTQNLAAFEAYQRGRQLMATRVTVNWCETHLALPAHAMLGNRQLMRQNACERFDSLGEKEVKEFVDGWFDEPTQATLRAVLERLKSKS